MSKWVTDLPNDQLIESCLVIFFRYAYINDISISNDLPNILAKFDLTYFDTIPLGGTGATNK